MRDPKSAAAPTAIITAVSCFENPNSNKYNGCNVKNAVSEYSANDMPNIIFTYIKSPNRLKSRKSTTFCLKQTKKQNHYKLCIGSIKLKQAN